MRREAARAASTRPLGRERRSIRGRGTAGPRRRRVGPLPSKAYPDDTGCFRQHLCGKTGCARRQTPNRRPPCGRRGPCLSVRRIGAGAAPGYHRATLGRARRGRRGSATAGEAPAAARGQRIPVPLDLPRVRLARAVRGRGTVRAPAGALGPARTAAAACRVAPGRGRAAASVRKLAGTHRNRHTFSSGTPD